MLGVHRASTNFGTFYIIVLNALRSAMRCPMLTKKSKNAFLYPFSVVCTLRPLDS